MGAEVQSKKRLENFHKLGVDKSGLIEGWGSPQLYSAPGGETKTLGQAPAYVGACACPGLGTQGMRINTLDASAALRALCEAFP